MNWAGFSAKSPESVPVFPALGRALGDGDMGLFLSVCAWLTSRAGGGSFTRRFTGKQDRWDFVLPWPKKRIRSHIRKVFLQEPGSVSQPLLGRICDNAYRKDPAKAGIYVFGSTPVLEALNDMLAEGSVAVELLNGMVISAGRLWWEGDIHVWRSFMAAELGSLPVFSQEREGYLPVMLDLVLQEMWAKWKAGVFTTDSGDFSMAFRSYLTRRYTSDIFLKLRLHEFDLFWAAARSIVGLRLRRPMLETDPHTYAAVKDEVLDCIDRARLFGLTEIGYLQRYSEYMTLCGRDPSMTHLLSEQAMEEVVNEERG